MRSLRMRPAFTAAVVLMLGLGIGAATTVWSFVYALLLRPYPYQSAHELVQVESLYRKEGSARRGLSVPDLDDYRRRATRIASIGAYTVYDNRLLGDGPPTVVRVAHVTADVLPLLGVAPVVGRWFTPDEDRPGGDVNKALISYEVWQTLLGGNPRILGAPLRTDRLTYTIVGVMPRGFGFPDRAGVWVPMESWYANLPPNDDRREKWRGGRWYATVARVSPPSTLAQAAADLSSIAAALEREYPADNAGVGIAVTPLREFEMGDLRPYLLVCLAGVGLLLVICCANVANLLIVRATERRREVAVQVALGATWWRIARGLLQESLTLGLAGAALGMLLALGGVRALLALIPVELPTWMRIEVDTPVLLVSAGLGLLTALLFGLGPILAGGRLDVTQTLRHGARGATRSPIRASLVVTEIALSVLLLVGAGLLMKTFLTLQQRNPGFRGAGVAAARIVLWAPGSRQTSAAALTQTHERVLAALRALPGVQSAAVTNALPYTGSQDDRLQADIFLKGRAEEETKTLAAIAGADVSAEYFATMRIPLIRGRLFTAADTTESEPVVVLSARAARQFWPTQDALGQLISWGKPTKDNPWTRVVGIVGDVKQHAAEGDTGIEFYYPITQWPVATSHYVVRTRTAPDDLLDTVRRTIVAAEPSAAVTDVKTMERTMTESLWQRQLWGTLFTAFAALALILAAVGLYGVISYTVAQRTRELGVRMALGATPAAMRGLVVREGMRLCAIGCVLGGVSALALGQVASSLLFQVAPHDAVTYVVAVVTISVTALAACWIPARRAARVDPSIALRSE